MTMEIVARHSLVGVAYAGDNSIAGIPVGLGNICSMLAQLLRSGKGFYQGLERGG